MSSDQPVVTLVDDPATLSALFCRSCSLFKDQAVRIYRTGDQEIRISCRKLFEDAVLVGQDRKGFAALLVSDHEEFKGRVEETFFSLRRETIERLTNNQVLEQIRKEINTRLKPKKGFKAHERQLSTAFLKKDLKSGEELTNTLKRKQNILERNERTRINQLFQ